MPSSFTFSDKIDAENDYNQEFKNAGFKDEAIWHVLKKNNQF